MESSVFQVSSEFFYCWSHVRFYQINGKMYVQQWWLIVVHGLTCSWLVGSSWIRDRTSVSYIGRWVLQGFPGVTVLKNLPANAGDAPDASLISGPGKSPGGGNDNPLQYTCLENSINRGAWQATVHGVAKNWSWLSNWACMNTYMHKRNACKQQWWIYQYDEKHVRI